MQKYRYCIRIGYGLFLISLTVSSQSAVKSPEERRSTIHLAEKLLDRSVSLAGKDLLENIGDPFAIAPVKVVEVTAPEKKVEKSLSPQELIPLLANGVKPNGIVEFGGEYYLLLRDTKVKSGGSVPVMYQNVEYNLEIVNVLRNGYSLGFEGAEVGIKLK
jgi:hypothetical protein